MTDDHIQGPAIPVAWDELSGDAAFRPGMLAYQALADAADLLRLVRHGADRLRLRGQAPTPPTPPTSTPPGPAGRA